MSLFGKAILRSLMLAALGTAALPSGQAKALTKLTGCFCNWKTVEVPCPVITYCDGSIGSFSEGSFYILESYGNQGESGNCGGQSNDANLSAEELCGPNKIPEGTTILCRNANQLARDCGTPAICPGSGDSDPNSIFASMPPAPSFFKNGYPKDVHTVFAAEIGGEPIKPFPSLAEVLFQVSDGEAPDPSAPPASSVSSVSSFSLSLSDPPPVKTWKQFSKDCRAQSAGPGGASVMVDGNGNTYRWQLDGKYHLIAKKGDKTITEKIAAELALVRDMFGTFESSVSADTVQQGESNWHRIKSKTGGLLMETGGHVYQYGLDDNGKGIYRYVGETALHITALGDYYVKPIVVKVSVAKIETVEEKHHSIPPPSDPLISYSRDVIDTTQRAVASSNQCHGNFVGTCQK